MDQNSGGKCSERQQLEGTVQRYLLELSELARLEVDTVAGDDQNRMLEIDRSIENSLGEKERALGALIHHREQHGC